MVISYHQNKLNNTLIVLLRHYILYKR